MPGFYITNCAPIQPANDTTAKCVQEQMQLDAFTICRNTRDQFLDDKLFYQDEAYIIVLEGVILNKKELLERFGVTNLIEAVKVMISREPECFFRDFRGMFSGAVYYAAEKKWIIFADHIGNRGVFYFYDGAKLIVGSQLKDVVGTMKHNAIKRIPDENGLRQFLTYGAYMDESTCVEGVKRILPGDYIRIQNGQLTCFTYYRFPEEPERNISDEEAIGRLDRAFRQAIKRGLDKNEEYGYTGIMDISGGADSRINAYVARDLGSKHEIMVHYSQSGSNEEQIAQRISHELGFEYYFGALDDARFLLDVDEIVAMNSGTGYYGGITGGKRMLEQLSGKPLGVEFTGLLGDIYEGAMITSMGEAAPTLEYGRYRFSDVVKPEEMRINTLDRFHTNNAFWLYTRGCLTGMSTFLTRQNYVEPYTPHGDVDFLEACMSIPWDRKVRDRLQLRWLAKCYPKAMEYPYATTGIKLSLEFHPMIKQFHRVQSLRRRLALKLTGRNKFNMNPFDQWEREKPWLIAFLNEYYQVHMERLEKSGMIEPALLEQIRQVYARGGLGKYVVITLLSSCKQFLLE